MLPVLTIFSLDQGKIYSPPPHEFDKPEAAAGHALIDDGSRERLFDFAHLRGLLAPSKAWAALRMFGAGMWRARSAAWPIRNT